MNLGRWWACKERKMVAWMVNEMDNIPLNKITFVLLKQHTPNCQKKKINYRKSQS
jgi:hypothetical protein